MTAPILPGYAAPVVDRYGLHAESCMCARCEAGYRPTIGQRYAAQKARERMEAAARERETREGKKARAQLAEQEAAAAIRRLERETDRRLQEERERMRAEPVPTAAELAALRAECGLTDKGGKRTW